MAINLFDFKEWSSMVNALILINKLIEFNVLPALRKCPRDHDMKIVQDNSVINNFKWMCCEKIRERNQKSKPSNYR